VCINDDTLFLVIALDFVGRWIEIGSACTASGDSPRCKGVARPIPPAGTHALERPDAGGACYQNFHHHFFFCIVVLTSSDHCE